MKLNVEMSFDVLNGTPHRVVLNGVEIPPSGYVVRIKGVATSLGSAKVNNNVKVPLYSFSLTRWEIEGISEDCLPEVTEGGKRRILVLPSVYKFICDYLPHLRPYFVTIDNDRMGPDGRIVAEALVI